MSTVPPYLKRGDAIGIVCPAGYLPLEKAQACMAVLQQWGYRVKAGATLGRQFHYFAGTDEERLRDLQELLDDPSVSAILCGRGGYGVSRLLDQLNFDRFLQYPKWIIGFSDITVLHAHLHQVLHTASLHASMVAAFDGEGAQQTAVQTLRSALEGQPLTYACAAHPLNRYGQARGILMGGNLSILAHLTGTSQQLDTAGALLFLEDVGEYLYHIDRMLLQLKRSGQLAFLGGLLIGGFTEMKDTVIPFGQCVYELIAAQVREYGYPVCFDFPVGHGAVNHALKVGMPYHFAVTEEGAQLYE